MPFQTVLSARNEFAHGAGGIAGFQRLLLNAMIASQMSAPTPGISQRRSSGQSLPSLRPIRYEYITATARMTRLNTGPMTGMFDRTLEATMAISTTHGDTSPSLAAISPL